MNQIQLGETPLNVGFVLAGKDRHRDRKNKTVRVDRVTQIVNVRQLVISGRHRSEQISVREIP